MGASHSVESEVITKEEIETPPPEVEEEEVYEEPELEMDWFWPFM